MNLLAIDPGTYHTGFYDGKNRWYKAYHKKLGLPTRLHDFMCALEDLLQTGGYDTVAFEKNFLRGIHATEALNAQCGIIMALSERFGCATLPIKITDWKKWANLKTGTKASGDKAPTIQLAETLSGLDRLNEHEADAIVIWNYVMATAQEGH